MRLTKAQRALARLLSSGMDARSIHRQEAARRGLLADFESARRGGLIVNAGYETSGAADDWLQSDAGRRALQEQGGGER